MTRSARSAVLVLLAPVLLTIACERKAAPPVTPSQTSSPAAAAPAPPASPVLTRPPEQPVGLFRATPEGSELTHYVELETADGGLRGTYTGAMDADFQAWFQAPMDEVKVTGDGVLSFQVGRRVLHAEALSPKKKVDPAAEGAGFATEPLTFSGRIEKDALRLSCAPTNECPAASLHFVRVDPASVP